MYKQVGPEDISKCLEMKNSPSMSSNWFTAPRNPSIHDKGLSTTKKSQVDLTTNQSQANGFMLLCAAHSPTVGPPMMDQR